MLRRSCAAGRLLNAGSVYVPIQPPVLPAAVPQAPCQHNFCLKCFQVRAPLAALLLAAARLLAAVLLPASAWTTLQTVAHPTAAACSEPACTQQTDAEQDLVNKAKKKACPSCRHEFGAKVRLQRSTGLITLRCLRAAAAATGPAALASAAAM